MYVTVAGEDKLQVYTVGSETGRINLQTEVVVEGRPAPLAISPDRTCLYVGQRDKYGIRSFLIDRNTGNISATGQVSLHSDPCFMSVDRTGQYILSAYYNAGGVSIHPVGKSREVGPGPTEWVETGVGAHSIQTDPSNRFAFVPHIADKGPNKIFQFNFDAETGKIHQNTPAFVHQMKNTGPRHYCFHPNIETIYFSNEQGCSVSAYQLDTSSGILTHFQTISTLPPGYVGSNTCSQIQITSNGRFLYAPNRGDNSIACFEVNASDGSLKPVGWVDAEPVPRVFSLDPYGKFLFSAGLDSGKLRTYQIDESTGIPNHIYTNDLGREPMWILVTDLAG